MTHNRLARETSPYLIQHADNPVAWWAWGPDALAEARATNKPILLSVGYAACHWCHVMAHESFEDEATAAVMNELYVCIKVDREERPDIDAIYMGALHRLGEQGGWPLTMFLDEQARPFWGGTYFPKDSRYGKPAFVNVLRQVAHIYANDRATIDHNATHITQMLAERPAGDRHFKISDASLEDLTSRLLRAVDPDNGGLQGAPKFPQWSFFWLLWRGAIRYDQPLAKAAVEKTLIHICQGGIYDHLGGGFARYATDERWLVPHFEKMLYDNALLIDLLTEVHAETANPLFAIRISETVAWLQREMMAEGGAFAASLDADSEGCEGKFYVWSYDELEEVLGAEDAREFGHIYDATPKGNWEGDHGAPSPVPTSILNRLGSRELMSEAGEDKLTVLRNLLLARRATRVRPGFDDKVLADWNGLMIRSLARASIAFAKPAWLALAAKAFSFIETKMTVDARLRHSYRAGRMTASATASDYANMIAAALALHQASLEPRYLASALQWLGVLDRHYWVADAGGDAGSASGGYSTTADDTADVLLRLRTAHDDAVPNANAMMLANLMHLFLITGESAHVDRADALVRAFAPDLAHSLTGHTGFLAQSLDLVAPQLVVLAEGQGIEELAAAAKVALPGALVYRIPVDASDLPAGLAGKSAIDGLAATYLCLGPQCSAPVTDAVELRTQLNALRRVPVAAAAGS